MEKRSVMRRAAPEAHYSQYWKNKMQNNELSLNCGHKLPMPVIQNYLDIEFPNQGAGTRRFLIGL